jgi:putative FmdB family regulatory protein
MPIYEYRCENGHTFEVLQKMTDDPVSVCSTCEAPVQRLFHPVAVHFKGKGFYNTDYGTKRRQRELERSGGSSSSSDDSGERPKSDTPSKADSGSSSSSSSSSSSGSDSKASGSGGDKKKSSKKS